MFRFIRILVFCASVYVFNNTYAANTYEITNDFGTMSCDDILIKLIRDSSFRSQFQDKKLALEFFHERHSDRYLMMKFVRGAGPAKNLIYANLELDLLNGTLKIIDPDPPIPIKINKKYISFISAKCTNEEDTYGNTGSLPNPDYDGEQ